MELIKSLKDLKEKLSLIEKTCESQESHESNRLNDSKSQKKYFRHENNEERLILKINSLCKSQNITEQVTINAGGKNYITLRSTLLNTIFPNIFQDKLNNISNNEDIFYDCSRKLFKHVLFIIRNMQVDSEVVFSDKNKLQLNLEETSNEEVLENIIKEVFYKDADSILNIVQMRPSKIQEVTTQTQLQIQPQTQPRNYDYDNHRARYDYQY
jgi:hypothetical protein